MSFGFNSQICKENGKAEYTIQITTDNYEQFLYIQEKARECVDGEHKKCDHVWYLENILFDKSCAIRNYKCAKCGAKKQIQ